MTRLLFTCILYICILPPTSHAQELIKDIGGEVHIWLDKIPQGQETQYGFENRADFALTTLGPVYQVYMLDGAFLNDPAPGSRNFLHPTGEWRVSVLLHDQIVLLLTAVQKDGGWHIVDLGARVLAQELDAVRQTEEFKNAPLIKMLRIYQLQCDFLFLDDPSLSSDKISLYPLHSARMNIAPLKDIQDQKRAMSDILPMLKAQMKKL
jgi:hypothetical protein